MMTSPVCALCYVLIIDRLWLTHGCITMPAADHVTCQCSHLTSFAVLMQYTEYKTSVNSAEGRALKLIGQIGCSVSLACLTLTFCVFVYLELVVYHIQFHYMGSL